MTDLTHGPQGLSAKPQEHEVKPQAVVEVPRSDGGTVLLHWLTAVSMVLSIATGLRISADGLTTSWAQTLSPILPQGEMWTWHMLGSITLFFCTVAYFVYVRRASLGSRNSSTRLRTLTPPTTNRLRWRAINVALHWLAYGAILALTVTGVLLYIGYGGLAVTVHKALAWTMLFYILIHTLAHFFYGGIAQLLRLFRPAPLVDTTASNAWPVSIAIAVGLTLAAGAYAIDLQTRPVLVADKIEQAPLLDGDLNDPAWTNANIVSVPTQQGANLGGTGTSTVTVRSVTTEDKIHFAFQWDDPTRSLMRSPVVKREDGWHVISSRNAQADVNDYYEDKFSALFSHNDEFGGGGSTFLGKNPLKAYPKSPHGRGLHYTDDGRMLDVWQWKSARGGMIGHVDDMHFGPPKAPTAEQIAGKKRYAAGYAADPGKAIYEYNYIAKGAKGYDDPVELKYLPLDLAKVRSGLGEIPKDADGQNSEDSIWWLTRENTIPYDAALDARIPVGTLLPSVLNIHTYEGDRADLAGGARWKDGKWTLEVSRLLNTGSPYDLSFQRGTRIYLWVSVFDHNQTRHTRHQRPITLLIK